MQQIFVDQQLKEGLDVILDDEQSHHLKNVLRMNNEVVRVVSNGQAFFGTLITDAKQVKVHLDKKDADGHDNKTNVTLFIGLIKKDKWDFVLQKATELGVNQIVPFISSRTIIKTSEEKLSNKLSRWQKIMVEASQQCKRDSIPTICEPIKFKDIIDYKADLKLVAYENEAIHGTHLLDVLKDEESINFVVGPEGGFSEEEVKLLTDNEYICISLGKRILRAETAVCYGLSAIDAIKESR